MYHRLLLLSLLASADAFVVAPAPRGAASFSSSRLYSTTEEVQSMRAGEIKKELESYGISTRTFLEKKELVEALNKARADGLKPKATSTASSSTSSTSSSSPSSGSSSSTSKTTETPEDTRPREERLAEEMEKCKTMKNGELKKELESRGISTKSFFEKSEFIKALANAIVDGVESGGGDGGGEGYAEYKNVEVLSANDAGPRTKKSGEAPAAQQSQQQSPFGGGGGGMPGGMGGIGDMLKNMGGGGGGMPGGMGGIGDMLNNMGGMGGGGGGDMMGQAQKMMQNPKVMELMMKAQSNPKMAKAMQEVMSNPAAFAKYQNDPEIAELMKELQELM